MIKRIVALFALAILASSCVTLPHSAHPLGAKAMTKPMAPEEGIELMIPVEGGMSFYNLNSNDFFDEPTMLDEISLRSYYGEAGLSFSKKIGDRKSHAAFSGGLSLFTYSGRSVGSREAEDFGLSPRQNYQGNGGRLNFSFDMNYDLEKDSKICWRILNVQLSYAMENGSYSNYRQVAIDSSAGRYSFDPYDNEYRVVAANSNFLSTHYYTEVLWDYDNYGFGIGLGGINFYSQNDLGVWGAYLFSPTMHIGFNVYDFYARLNFGTLNPSSSIFGGTSNTNVLIGYRFQL